MLSSLIKKSASAESGLPESVQQLGPSQEKAMKFRFGNGDTPLPGFTIKRGVGIGGFGEVYFAVTDAGKEVALKQIQRNLEVEVRGVRQCMNLKHPNLIALYDIKFDDQEQGWIVMEYVSGSNLRDAVEANPHGMPESEIERWFGQIVAGVAYLHDHGIVHRDLKPANIFQEEGIVKIGDYGLSKFISCSRRGGQTESVGTFHYMAPEIGKGEYGKEIDVYALGVMLYEMGTGLVPFDGESSQEIIMKHLTADPDLSLLPAKLRPVVARALAKNPRARFDNVRHMLPPLGMALDPSYLVTRGQPVPPVVADDPPTLTSSTTGFAPGSGQPVQSFHTAHSTQDRGGPAKPSAVSSRARQPVTGLKFQEPIARNLYSGWSSLNRSWADLKMNASAKTLLLVCAIIFLAFNAGTVLSCALLGLMFYVPYYAVWWTLRGPAPASLRASAARPPVAAAALARPAMDTSGSKETGFQPNVQRPRSPVGERPLSHKQWRTAKRMQLARMTRREVWSEVTGCWLGATAVISVFSVLAGLFQIGTGRPVQPQLMGMIWAALTALATTWLAIGLGKRWQREEGDWAIRSFVQLTSGFALGLFAFILAEYLMVPWPEITRENIGQMPTHRWRGFFAADGSPLLPAYLAYFPLLMGLIQWWKQVDPLRRVRFSFWPVLWSVIAATIVHLLIPFPQPWVALIAAGASIAIQLSSPWINSNERVTSERCS